MYRGTGWLYFFSKAGSADTGNIFSNVDPVVEDGDDVDQEEG